MFCCKVKCEYLMNFTWEIFYTISAELFYSRAEEFQYLELHPPVHGNPDLLSLVPFEFPSHKEKSVTIKVGILWCWHIFLKYCLAESEEIESSILTSLLQPKSVIFHRYHEDQSVGRQDFRFKTKSQSWEKAKFFFQFQVSKL